MRVALVTLYNPTTDVKHNLNAISKQVDILYVCDNSEVNNYLLVQDIVNVSYIFCGENLGLSAAFNLCLKNKRLSWKEEDYIIFFDQDSYIELGHISTLIEEYEKLEKSGYKVGCIGPVYYNCNRNEIEIQKVKKPISDKTYQVKSIITSSMLCRYGDLKKINFWNEKVFLDMADWDLCWRFMQHKKICCVTTVVTLKHTLGIGDKKCGFFRIRIGAPIREYYQIRDSLYLLLQKYTPIKFKLRFIELLFIRSLLHLLFLDHKRERIYYITKGIKDFCMKKNGRIDNGNCKKIWKRI